MTIVYGAGGPIFGAPKGGTPRRAEAYAIAERFAEAQGGAFLYHAERKAWLAWDGAAWRRDVRGRVRETIREAVEAALAEAGGGGNEAGSLDGWQGGTQETQGRDPHAGVRGSGRLAAAVEIFARGMLAEPRPFDADRCGSARRAGRSIS